MTVWEQLVQVKAQYLGGTLIDDGSDRISNAAIPIPSGGMRTEIVDVFYRENGRGHHYFEVEGKDFSCGGDTHYLSVVGPSQHGAGLHFVNPAIHHEWHMLKGNHENKRELDRRGARAL